MKRSTFSTGNFFGAQVLDLAMDFPDPNISLMHVFGYLFRNRIVIYVFALVFLLLRPRKVKLKDILAAYRYDVSPILKLLLLSIAVAALALTFLATARFITS